MASRPVVTLEQAASAGPAAGVCYYCGAPLGTAHHSYCTLIKALPPPQQNAQPPQGHHYMQYGAAASMAGFGMEGQLPTGGGMQEFLPSTSLAADGSFASAHWQPNEQHWFHMEASPPTEGWQEAPPPPPPPPEEAPPPLPGEDGHAPPPPAEQPPPPPEEPAAGAWETGRHEPSAQPTSTGRTWAAQVESVSQHDTLSAGVSSGTGPFPNGAFQNWQGQDWGYGGVGAGEASTTGPAHERTSDWPPTGQQPFVGAVQLPSSVANAPGPIGAPPFAGAPWHQTGAQLPRSTGPSLGGGPGSGVPSAGGSGGGTGMESIRDLYAAPNLQRLSPPTMLPSGPNYGVTNPQLFVPPVAALPFPVHSTPPLPFVPEQPRRVDARHIFKPPGRSTRPDRFVVILRGLPGSGKSHLARALRDVEVMHGGAAPRVHTMDDYFVTEVEKEVEVEDARGRKRRTAQTAMEYVYEPELEQAYCQSMLKAFRKTLDEGRFHFVIVDYWNLVVSDFEPYWKAAKSSGFEVYVLQPAKLDPQACASRNIHGFSLEAVTDMSRRWEALPPQYLQLDVQALFRGDLLDTGDIEEVDMDAETDVDPAPPGPPAAAATKRPLYESDDDDAETPHHEPPSRPSARPDKGAIRDRGSDKRARVSPARTQPGQPEAAADKKGKGGRRKEVKWADLEGEKEAAKGFRIGMDLSKKRKLEIGPGAGYTQDQTGPLHQHDSREHAAWARKVKAQVRDEAEAFKAGAARRRQRLGVDEEDD